MNVKYISWNDLLNTRFKTGVIYAIEIHTKLNSSTNNLIQVYLRDQSKALDEFEIFKSTIQLIASESNRDIDTADIELNDLLVEVEWILEEPVHDQAKYLEAQLKAYAILISARLAYLALSKDNNLHWLDARDIIVTNEDWTKAVIEIELSKSRLLQLDEQLTYISTQGIGASPDNQNTLTLRPQSWNELVE